MATNSNNHGGNGQRPAGSGRRPSGNGQRPAGQRPAGSRPAGNSNGQRRVSAKQRAAKKRRKVIIFGVEIAVILIMVAVLYLVMTHTNNEGPKVTVLETEELRIPEEVQQDEAMKGYMNIALFGVDSREGSLDKEAHSDTILIASINNKTKDVKLVSVYRDTYLDNTNGEYRKATECYYFGGPSRAISMLNKNLDLDITDFVTVDFTAVADVVDALGGIDIDVQEDEIVHLNNYQVEGSQVTGKEIIPVEYAGLQTLNGLQALSYCRIRYTDRIGGTQSFRMRSGMNICRTWTLSSVQRQARITR